MAKKKKDQDQERKEESSSSIQEISACTMVGDLMSLVTDELKAAPDVWQKLGESEQGECIDRIRRRIDTAVEECVRLIATEGFARIRATVESVAVKDGIKATLTLSRHDGSRHELIDAQGTTVYIVLADAEQFGGGRYDIQPDPDQGALTLNEVEKIGRKSAESDSDDLDKAA